MLGGGTIRFARSEATNWDHALVKGTRRRA